MPAIMPSGAKCTHRLYAASLLLLPTPASPLPRRAGLSLYGIQIASQNVERNPSSSHHDRRIITTPTPPRNSPARRICDTRKIAHCAERDTCQDSEIHEEEEEGNQPCAQYHDSRLSTTAHCTLWHSSLSTHH